MTKRFLYGWLIGLSLGCTALAQDNPPATIPQGRFLTDSFEVGRPFRFALSFRHAATEDVLFPDSTVFAPFLLRETAVLPTRTEGGISVDSAVYTLVAFNTQPRLTLRVPLYIIGAGDCTTVYSSTDTVFFRSKLQSARIDTLQLKPSTEVVPLRQQLNYPVLAVTLLIIGLGLGLMYAVFGRSINKQWRLWQLYRDHARFMNRYDRFMQSITPDTASEIANQVLVRWKQYMERLEQQPYLTMTTPEIVDQITGQDSRGAKSQLDIEGALKTTDRMVYGGAFTDESVSALQLLREVAVRTYERRRAVPVPPVATTPDTQPSEPI